MMFSAASLSLVEYITLGESMTEGHDPHATHREAPTISLTHRGQRKGTLHGLEE